MRYGFKDVFVSDNIFNFLSHYDKYYIIFSYNKISGKICKTCDISYDNNMHLKFCNGKIFLFNKLCLIEYNKKLTKIRMIRLDNLENFFVGINHFCNDIFVRKNIFYILYLSGIFYYHIYDDDSPKLLLGRKESKNYPSNPCYFNINNKLYFIDSIEPDLTVVDLIDNKII